MLRPANRSVKSRTLSAGVLGARGQAVDSSRANRSSRRAHSASSAARRRGKARGSSGRDSGRGMDGRSGGALVGGGSDPGFPWTVRGEPR